MFGESREFNRFFKGLFHFFNFREAAPAAEGDSGRGSGFGDWGSGAEGDSPIFVASCHRNRDSPQDSRLRSKGAGERRTLRVGQREERAEESPPNVSISIS